MPASSQSNRITEDLRDDILRGRYRAGDRLPSERELADRFQVQRAPVREALKKLEQLGLAEIKPGGVRVCALQTASLDVVKHLLALSDPPDPEIVQMVIEVHSALLLLAARLGTQRGTDAQIERCVQLLEEFGNPEVDEAHEHEIILELCDLLVEASGNLVLSLAHRGIRLQFLENLEGREQLLHLPATTRVPMAQALAQALNNRDGKTLSDLLGEIATQVGENAVRIIRSQIEPETLTQRAGTRNS